MKISHSCTPIAAAPVKDWTLLYVLDGDNDLREAATLDLVELDRHGAPENVHVAAQLYRGELGWGRKTWTKKLGSAFAPPQKSAVAEDWRGMRVFETRAREDAASVTREVAYPTTGGASPNSPTSLEDFLVWGMTEYPAKHFAVIMAGHGTPDGILADSRLEVMTMEDAAGAIARASARVGKKPDLLVLDACSTASPETAQAFRGTASYLVASPQKIGGGGWSEEHTLEALSSEPGITARGFAESFLSPSHTAVPTAHLYNLSDGTLEASR